MSWTVWVGGVEAHSGPCFQGINVVPGPAGETDVLVRVSSPDSTALGYMLFSGVE